MLIFLALLLTNCSKVEPKLQSQKSTKPKKYIWPTLRNPQQELITCDYQNKTIEVYLKNGRGIFSACEDYQVQRLGYVSAGRPSTHKTSRGTYEVQWKAKEYDSKKYPSAPGQSNNMNNAMFFNNGIAMHRGNINGLSHGCVRTQEYQSEWLYEWSPHGTRIVVKDMSEIPKS